MHTFCSNIALLPVRDISNRRRCSELCAQTLPQSALRRRMRHRECFKRHHPPRRAIFCGGSFPPQVHQHRCCSLAAIIFSVGSGCVSFYHNLYNHIHPLRLDLSPCGTTIPCSVRSSRLPLPGKYAVGPNLDSPHKFYAYLKLY